MHLKLRHFSHSDGPIPACPAILGRWYTLIHSLERAYLRHVDTNSPPFWSNFLRGEQNIDTSATAQINHRLALFRYLNTMPTCQLTIIFSYWTDISRG